MRAQPQLQQQQLLQRLRLLVVSPEPEMSAHSRDERPVLFAMVDHSVPYKEQLLCLNDAVQVQLQLALDHAHGVPATLLHSIAHTVLFDPIRGDCDFISSEDRTVQHARFRVCPVRTRHAIQTAYNVPADAGARWAWYTSLVRQLYQQPFFTEFVVWKNGACDEHGAPLLDLGDPLVATEQRMESCTRISATMERLVLQMRPLEGQHIQHAGQEWVLHTSAETGEVSMASTTTDDRCVLVAVPYQWSYEVKDEHTMATKEYRAFSLAQQKALERYKRCGKHTVLLSGIDNHSAMVVDLMSQPMMMWPYGCEFQRVVVQRTGAAYSQQQKRFLQYANACSGFDRWLMCRNSQGRPLQRLPKSHIDTTTVLLMFDKAIERNRVESCPHAQPVAFAPLPWALKDQTSPEAQCLVRQICNIYSLHSLAQERLYCEHVKALTYRHPDLPQHESSIYLRRTVPPMNQGLQSVNEAYLWCMLPPKMLGPVLMGGKLPAPRTAATDGPWGCVHRLSEKIDQAEASMLCPRCNRPLSIYVGVEPESCCHCVYKEPGCRSNCSDAPEPCVLLLCKVALGSALVVAGPKQFTMHQDMMPGDDTPTGMPHLNVCGSVAVVCGQEESCPVIAECADELIGRLRQRGYGDVLERCVLRRDLDVKRFRYVFFVVDVHDPEFLAFCQNIAPGTMSSMSFIIYDCSGGAPRAVTSSPRQSSEVEKAAAAAAAAAADDDDDENVALKALERGGAWQMKDELGPRGEDGVPDSVLVEDMTADDQRVVSPYESDKRRCREYFVYESDAVLPLFAVVYNRYNNRYQAREGQNDVGNLEDIILQQLKAPPDCDL